MPSREMILRLMEALTVPKHARNDWLVAAGFAPLFHERPLDSHELKPFHAAVTRLLRQHDPYPGWAIDGRWRIIMTNDAGSALLGRFGIGTGDSLVEAITEDPTLGGALVNWQEVVSHLAIRLGAEARRRNDEHKAAVALRLAAMADPPTDGPLPAAIPTKVNYAGRVVALTSIQALFNTAEDLTLADLRVELFFPLDTPSEEAFEDRAPVAAKELKTKDTGDVI